MNLDIICLSRFNFFICICTVRVCIWTMRWASLHLDFQHCATLHFCIFVSLLLCFFAFDFLCDAEKTRRVFRLWPRVAGCILYWTPSSSSSLKDHKFWKNTNSEKLLRYGKENLEWFKRVDLENSEKKTINISPDFGRNIELLEMMMIILSGAFLCDADARRVEPRAARLECLASCLATLYLHLHHCHHLHHLHHCHHHHHHHHGMPCMGNMFSFQTSCQLCG